VASQLARLVGLAQARHLRRVLDLFDEGNLAEALRHAIPVDGDGGTLGQAFGTPRRRDSLEVARLRSPATRIQLGQELQAHLRTLYRQAFTKLNREQRIDEAVFVLAELLNARREALDYLERHQRFAQAAELALGWDMEPALIVRLLCLAGDWRHAVAVARRDGAFATAVFQLERRWPDVARRLREEWGNALLQQGNWVGAVNAVWPLPSLRAQAGQWLLTAESSGGRLAARALAQRAVLLPDTLERHAQQLLALQCDRSCWRERVALAEALMGLERTAATRLLAALITPAVLADHAQGHRRFGRGLLKQLLRYTGDVLLQVDLPSRSLPCAQAGPAGKQDVLDLEAPEAGLHGILDAVPLDDERCLLALGEGGSVVIDAAGRVRARFSAPAQRLVIAHSRQVALLLARRESLWRVTRLDLARRTVADLGELDFHCCGTQFDGISWTIARGRRLQVLDIQDSSLQVVWQVADLPGNVCALATSAIQEQIVLEAGERPAELWIYKLPLRQLIARDPMPSGDGQLLLLNPWGRAPYALTLGESSDHGPCLRRSVAGEGWELPLQTDRLEELRLWLSGEWLVVRTLHDSGYRVLWLHWASGAEHVRAQWPTDAAPEVRPLGEEWLLFDARGRLLYVNISSREGRSCSLR
jgi:hypothetical protein